MNYYLANGKYGIAAKNIEEAILLFNEDAGLYSLKDMGLIAWNTEYLDETLNCYSMYYTEEVAANHHHPFSMYVAATTVRNASGLLKAVHTNKLKIDNIHLASTHIIWKIRKNPTKKRSSWSISNRYTA